MTEQGLSAALKGGVCTRAQARRSKEPKQEEDDVEGLVERLSDLSMDASRKKPGATTKKSNGKSTKSAPGVHKTQKSRVNMEKSDESGDADSELSAARSQTAKPPCVPIGLENPGNMCYFNAVLQALSFSAAFVNWIGGVEYKKKITKIRKDEDAVLGMAVLLDIQEMLDARNASNGGKGMRTNAVRQLRSHTAVEDRDPDTGIGGSGQQDAQELTQLVFFSLQHVQDLCSSQKTKRCEERASMNDTTSGRTYVTRKCTACKSVVTTEDTWNILTVHVSSGDQTLSDCFQNISEKQTLDGDDMVFCSKCKMKTKTIQQSRLSSAGDLLVVHINLSIQGKSGIMKLQKTVEIPTSHFLKLYSPAKKRYRKDGYELTAVVMHRGVSTQSGHYTVYVRNEDDQWFLCNDERVSRVQEEKLPFLQSKKKTTPNPYLLFFSKV